MGREHCAAAFRKPVGARPVPCPSTPAAVSTHPRILIVDNHRKVREPLAVYLRRHAFEVVTAADAAQMWSMISHHTFDAVVLDVMLPDGNGFDLCQSLHRRMNLPVILLTAMGEATDRVHGLDLGADDYVVKPFEPRELVARINSVLRRRDASLAASAARPEAQARAEPAERYRFANLDFYSATHVLHRQDGEHVSLTTAQGRLLMVFLQHPNTLLSRDRLLDLTTRPGADVFDRSIDRQVSRLRQKLAQASGATELLRTVWGDGYILATDVQRETP